ncbi:MAG: late competence development ComFB family protein, partial [Exilispira sp.]
MKIKNTLEDLVYNLAESIIASYNDNIPKNSKFKLDVICYVLNRILPEYLVSYRGLIYEEIKFKYDSQKVTDIISLIYEAIRTIKNRRKEESLIDVNEEIEWGFSPIESKDYFYNFPQIIGQVFNSSNFEPVDDATVLLVDEKNNKVEMASSLWKNPLETSLKTNGIFTF